MPIELQDHRQRVGGVYVVVHDEYALSGYRESFRARLGGSRRLDARQADFEGRALSEAFAARSNLAAVHLDEALYDG